jgi:hypothetical protein
MKKAFTLILACTLAFGAASAFASGGQDIQSDPTVFTWGGHDSVDDRPITSGTRSIIGNELAERVGVRSIPFGWGHNVQDMEKTSLMIAADEHPEVHAYWQSSQRTWYLSGAYRSIPVAMVREHAPNFAASMDAIGPGAWVAMAAPDDPDAIWSFPKMQATHFSATRVGGNARYDWILATDMADKMNVPIDERSTQDSPRGVLDAEQRIPNTFFYTYQTVPLSLVEEFLRKVIDLDPVGGGRTIGYIPQGDARNMCGWQGAGHICMALGMNDQRFSIMEGADGAETINLISPQARRSLEKIQDWFQKGLIDPEYVTNDFATFRAKLAAGLGAMSGRGGPSCNPESETGDTYCGAWLDNHDVKMISFDALTDEDGSFIRSADSFGPLPMIFDGEVTVIKHDVSDEKVINFLKFYDYVAHTCEGNILASYGLEGVHWTADKDPCTEDGLSPTGALIDTTLSGGGPGRTLGAVEDPGFEVGIGYFRFDTSPAELFTGYGSIQDPGHREWWGTWRGVGGAGVQPLDKPYKFDLFADTDALDKQTEFVGQLRAISDEYFYSTIASGASVADSWDGYVQTMLNAGGQAILDEYAKLDYTTDDLAAGRVNR